MSEFASYPAKTQRLSMVRLEGLIAALLYVKYLSAASALSDIDSGGVVAARLAEEALNNAKVFSVAWAKRRTGR